jgi:tetrahydromethanopterin S-methyltransferase subunit G
VDPCPNKAAAITGRPVPVTAADLADVKKRLDKIEAKVKP